MHGRRHADTSTDDSIPPVLRFFSEEKAEGNHAQVEHDRDGVVHHPGKGRARSLDDFATARPTVVGEPDHVSNDAENQHGALEQGDNHKAGVVNTVLHNEIVFTEVSDFVLWNTIQDSSARLV